MIELKEKNYLVKVSNSSVESGENVLLLGDKVLLFKEPAWRGIVISIEKRTWDAFRSYAKKKRTSLRRLLLEIVYDASIPVFPLALREVKKLKKEEKLRRVRKGITLKKEDIEKIKQIKGDQSLHRFLAGKIYGWYFNQDLTKNG